MSNTTITTKSLVNVSVMETTKNADIIRSINNALTGVENSAFKIAVKVAYLLGKPIPCGHGTITNNKPLKPKEVYTKISKSKATISRWIKALQYVIDNNLFESFNNGVYPFSFDKIILIYANELVNDDNTFDNLINMTVSALEKLTKAEDEAEEQAEEQAEDEAEDEAEDDSPLVTFDYAGQTFSVHENALLAFIEQACTLA